jgi:iron(III) transport system ATP-binding protein
MTALQLADVHKSFGATRVLRGLHLSVAEGSLTAVLGPSGSGKTTLLRVVGGFERADSGSVTLAGVQVDGPRRYVPPERRGLGYVSQDGALFPHLTVAGNVAFGLRGRDRRRERIDDLLELVGLAQLRARHPHELSGGQQQRVALARALAVEPRMVLLDEPFTALDPALRASVRAEVGQIIRRAGTTAVLVTHDQDEALSLADHVAVLRDGVVIQHAPPHELYTEPADAELARFLGEANLVPARLEAGHAVTRVGRLPVRRPSDTAARLPDGTPVVALVRPEQLRIRVTGSGDPTGSPGLPGQVVQSEYYGHDAVVRVRPAAADGEPALLTVRLHGDAPPPLGTPVVVTAEGATTVWPSGATASSGATVSSGATASSGSPAAPGQAT